MASRKRRKKESPVKAVFLALIAVVIMVCAVSVVMSVYRKISKDYENLEQSISSSETPGETIAIENGVVTVVRRDTLEKFTMPIQGIGENLVKLMADIHQTMYDMALEHRKAHTTHAENFGDFMDGVKKGFVKAPWCADPDCEMEIKCVTGASTRCKPMDEDTTVKPGCKCVFCNREAKTMMYFARAY